MAATYEDMVTDQRPFRRRNLIALGLLIGAFVGFAVTLLWARESDHSLLSEIILHAFEGAVVGGLCDWYAVAKTYRAVEVNRDSVADAIGRWVANELLSHHVIHERITALLHDKEVQEELVTLLDDRLGTTEDTERWLTDRWDELQPTVVEWGSTIRFDEDALAEIDATFLDQRLTSAMETCLGTAMLSLSQAPELDKLIDVALKDTNWFIKLVGGLNAGRIRGEIARIGSDLRDRAYSDNGGNGSEAARVLAVAMPPLRHALAGYIKGWNALSEEQRTEAVIATLGHLRDPLVSAMVELVHRLHEELRKTETLIELSLIQNLVDSLKESLDQGVSDKIGEVVTGALKNQSPEEFRKNLENNTRNHLEMIRINGTLLGFVVGGIFGVILGLVG